jgi:membrane-associated phospholipid phosphatase
MNPRPGLVLVLPVVFSCTCLAVAHSFFDYLVDDTSELYRGSSFWTAIGGSGLTILAIEIESRDGYPGILGDSGFLPTAGDLTDAAFGLPLLGASSVLWLGSELADAPGPAMTGQMLTEGLLVSYGITGGLKLLTGRERPDGSDRFGFPSLHTAGTFCTAVILWDRYGSGAGIPAGVLAAFTGISRIDLGAHYPSDVLAGATVGILTGLAVSRAHGVESGNGRDGFMVGWDSTLGIMIGF